MDGAAPVRPWQPAYCPVKEDGLMHTRFSLVNAYSTRRHDSVFNVRVRLFSRDGRANGGPPKAAYEAQYDAVPFASGLRVEMKDLIAPGSTFDGIAEVLVEDPDSRPPLPSRANILHSWVYLYSEDGSQFVLSPCYQQKGGMKKLWSSQYQLWPGVVVNEECDSEVILINPYDKRVTALVTVYNPVGDRLSCHSDIQIEPKTYFQGRLADVIPGLSEFLAPWKGIGTLLLDQRYKLNNYVWLRHVKSGHVTCMDHFQQFPMRALEAVDVETRGAGVLTAAKHVNPEEYV